MFHTLQQRWKTHSLFLRLLVSFMIIIVLLVSFHFYSFVFFRNNIHNEIIQYNQSNLTNTTESFENHFLLLNNLVLGLYLNDHVQVLLHNKNINYMAANQVRRDIQNVVSNPLLYLDNLVLYVKDSTFILEKGGSTKAVSMFTKFYQSDEYPYSFWKNEFRNDYTFRIFPASTFTEIIFNNLSSIKGQLFPIIIKNKLYPDYYFIALVDSKKMIHAYHQSINENFYILNDQGTRLFALDNTNKHTLPALDYSRSYVKKGNDYYFYKKGSLTGLTYVNIIPDETIASQMVRLNVTLVSLLLVAVAISVITSILFSMKINNPVKQMIQSLQHFNTLKPAVSKIREFNFIIEKFSSMIQRNQAIHQDLINKNSLLRSYAYTNRLKKIHSSYPDPIDPLIGNKPFTFVLFQLHFKNQFYKEIDSETTRAIYFIREFISQSLLDYFPEANTFQVENSQIISLIFTDGSKPILTEVVQNMRKVFELDKDFCYLTIVLSSPCKHASQFTEAYDQVIKRVDQRKLTDDTQIIIEDSKQGPVTVLTPAAEKEFDTYLQAGNETSLIQLTRKWFLHMEKKDATAKDYYDLADPLIKKAIQSISAINVGHKNLNSSSLFSQLMSCHNLEQLDRFLVSFLTEATLSIKQSKEERDHITSFVMDYIEEYYTEDISLDSVAEKMEITGGYLSSYFKEKTGKNFIDYLHEVRINKAKEALINSNRKIQNIASEVGYQNINSFNRMFKKFAGLTPSQFRHTIDKKLDPSDT